MPDESLADVTRAPAPAQPAPQPLLAPGRNCWRIEHARRVAFLVDGEEFFTAVRAALAKAQRSIFILGWDIDSKMLLVPGGARDGYPEPLCEFLNAIVSERRRLRAYVLTWDFAMLYALEREWLPLYKLDAKTHRRLSFRLDDRHPVGASHHQKVVVVDDQVAFVSGFDLTRVRWDTSAHAADEPLRVDAAGKPYAPFHDLGAMVDGACARTLGELARMRWKRATGHDARAASNGTGGDAWPVHVAPVLTDVRVAVSRTEPAYADNGAVQEIRQLHLDAIARARRFVFAENQYFTSRTVADAFAQRLAASDAPEIAVISPYTQSGWLEISTMGVLRARIHRLIQQADRQDRYRLYSPALPWLPPSEGCLNVHSKLLIVDDELLTVGSANLSDRSMALDTECNLALEANGDPRIVRAIAGLRERLLAEHLASSSDEVRATMARTGSLHATIAALTREGERALHPTQPYLDPMVDAVTPDHGVLDPERPLDPDLIIDEVYPAPEHRDSVKGKVVLLLAVVLVVAALAIAWRMTPLGQWLRFEELVDHAHALNGRPVAPLLVALAFVVGGLMLVPVTLLIAVSVLVFGPVEGAAYALLGATLSASATYGIGRHLGRDLVRRLAGHRLNELSRRLGRRGLLAIVLVRMMPIAPFTVMNVVAGASHIGWRDFLLGTMIGLVPGILMTSVFVDSAIAAIRHPSPATFALLGAVALGIAGLATFVRRRLDRPAVRGPRTHAA